MRIGFVLQDTSRRPATGLDAYTARLWEALRALDTKDEFVPVTLPHSFAVRAYLRALWEQTYLPLWAARMRLDLLHVPAGSAPVVRGQPCVLTLHDLGDEAAPRYRTPLGPRLYFGTVAPRSARFASAVIADSAATKRDAIQRLGLPEERITVIPLGPAPGIRRAPQDAVERVRRKYGLRRRYFLQVGSLIPRKNLAGALAAFVRLLARRPDLDVSFVAAGSGDPATLPLPLETGQLIACGRVRLLGRVADDDLAALYSGAVAVVMPSFYEGFGLPLVEAFACGTPAIASRTASLPEVGGEAAAYVDPGDPDTIASAMERYAMSSGYRAEMAARATERAQLFSWRSTAERTLEVYGRALQGRGRRSPRPDRWRSAPKVLFVRLDSLGDLVLTTPCFRAVKRRFPEARVDVLVQPATAPLAASDPNVDRVFTLSPPWRSRWRPGAVRDALRMMRRLRHERYDYVIVPRRDLDDALFARLCGGRETAGYDARRTRLLLSRRLPFDRGRHTLDNHLRLMALLGCDDAGLLPAVACSSGRPEVIDNLLSQADGQILIGVAPFASSLDKTLDSSRTAALVDALAAIPQTSVVLVGAPADRTRANEIARRTPAPVTDLVGRTDLPALCDVLRRCRIVVSVDSGPMHLAAALGVSTVALFGEEDPVLWGPRGPSPCRVLRAMDERVGASVNAIPVEMAVAAVRELLGDAEDEGRVLQRPVEVAS